MTVRRWKSADPGSAEVSGLWSGEVPVDMTGGFLLLPPGNGEFVCQVTARWGVQNTCEYAFRTAAQLRPRT